ncbi:MAG: DUF934 domain-containing protein [Ferrovum sp.]|nr:DUF934 domain-containing protein [Ferrovum sp.]NDU87375.1 DUF934 domain-containing protein [Ferrovum sp.]
MPEVIIDRRIVQDTWQHWQPELPPQGDYWFTVEEWRERRGLPYHGQLGLQVETDQPLEELAPYLAEAALVIVRFSSFTDGRGHSLARLLRHRYGFTGELRASGDVFRDSLHELERCGFNSFALRSGETAENALLGLGLFSEAYQSSVAPPEPLFRRRLTGIVSRPEGD